MLNKAVYIIDMKIQPMHVCMCVNNTYVYKFNIIGILTLPIVLHMSMIVHAICTGKDTRKVIILKFTIQCVTYDVRCCWVFWYLDWFIKNLDSKNRINLLIHR